MLDLLDLDISLFTTGCTHVMCVRARACVSACVCVRACVRACARARAHVRE